MEREFREREEPLGLKLHPSSRWLLLGGDYDIVEEEDPPHLADALREFHHQSLLHQLPVVATTQLESEREGGGGGRGGDQ